MFFQYQRSLCVSVSKIKQVHYTKGDHRLFCYEHRYNISQQNTIKPNSTVNVINYILGSNKIYSGSSRKVKHMQINRHYAPSQHK